MEDLAAKLNNLRNEAADCDLIASLSPDRKKREFFRKLATRLRRMSEDIEAAIAAKGGEATRAGIAAPTVDATQNPPTRH